MLDYSTIAKCTDNAVDWGTVPSLANAILRNGGPANLDSQLDQRPNRSLMNTVRDGRLVYIFYDPGSTFDNNGTAVQVGYRTTTTHILTAPDVIMSGVSKCCAATWDNNLKIKIYDRSGVLAFTGTNNSTTGAITWANVGAYTQLNTTLSRGFFQQVNGGIQVTFNLVINGDGPVPGVEGFNADGFEVFWSWSGTCDNVIREQQFARLYRNDPCQNVQVDACPYWNSCFIQTCGIDLCATTPASVFVNNVQVGVFNTEGTLIPINNAQVTYIVGYILTSGAVYITSDAAATDIVELHYDGKVYTCGGCRVCDYTADLDGQAYPNTTVTALVINNQNVLGVPSGNLADLAAVVSYLNGLGFGTVTNPVASDVVFGLNTQNIQSITLVNAGTPTTYSFERSNCIDTSGMFCQSLVSNTVDYGDSFNFIGGNVTDVAFNAGGPASTPTFEVDRLDGCNEALYVVIESIVPVGVETPPTIANFTIPLGESVVQYVVDTTPTAASDTFAVTAIIQGCKTRKTVTFDILVV